MHACDWTCSTLKPSLPLFATQLDALVKRFETFSSKMEGNLDNLYKKLGADIQRVEVDLEFAMRGGATG